MGLKKWIKQIFCLHKDGKIICWHWTRGDGGYMDRHIEIEFKCLKCDKIYYRYIFDKNNCDLFALCNRNTEWSETCKPSFMNK